VQTISSQNVRQDYYDGTAVLLVMCSGISCNAVTAAVCSLCLLYLFCFFFLLLILLSRRYHNVANKDEYNYFTMIM